MINIRIILFLVAGTIGFFLLLRFQGKLTTDKTPMGIVSLELAHQSDTVQAITTSWNEAGLTRNAKNNVWIDFLFIPFYAMLFYTLCGSISVRMQGLPAKLGVFTAFGSLVAGLLDIGENILMLFSLNGYYNQISAWMTSAFAFGKFFLLALAFIYILPLGIRLLLLKLTNK